MKLKDFQIAQAQKAGIDTNLAENKAYFDALPDLEVPETVVTGIDSALISLQDAKNNHADIKAHYFVQALNSVDSIIENAMGTDAFTDEDRKQVKEQRSSYKRLEKLVEKLENAKTKAASGGGNKDHQAEIDRLNAQIRAEKDRFEAAELQYKNDLQGFKVNTKSSSFWSRGSMKTVYDGLSDEIRDSSLKTAAEIELKRNGLHLALDENDNPVLRKSDGSNYYGADNRIVTPQKYFETAFSQSKIIVPNPGANGTAQQSNGAPTSVQAATANGGKIDINAGAKSHNARMLEQALKSAEISANGLGML